MFNISKKILLFSLFCCSSLQQAAFFRNSHCVRYSSIEDVVYDNLIDVDCQDSSEQIHTNDLKNISIKCDNQTLQDWFDGLCLNKVDPQAQDDFQQYIVMKDDEEPQKVVEPSPQYLGSHTIHMPNSLSSDNNSNAAQQNLNKFVTVIQLQQQVEQYKAAAYAKLADYNATFYQKVFDKAEQIYKFDSSASKYEITVQKENLIKIREVLEHKLLVLLQDGKINYIYNFGQPGINESMSYFSKETWTTKDYSDALKAMDIKIHIDAISAAIKMCNDRLCYLDNQIVAFEKMLTNFSVDRIENNIISDLEKDQEAVQDIISEKTDACNQQIQALKDKIQQLELFENKFFISKAWQSIMHGQSKLKYLQEKQKAEAELLKTKHEIMCLRDKSETYQKYIDVAQKVVEHKKEFERAQAKLALERQEQELLQRELQIQKDLQAKIEQDKQSKQDDIEQPLQDQQLFNAQNIHNVEQGYPAYNDPNTICLPRDLEFLQQQYQAAPQYLVKGIDSKTLQDRHAALQKTVEQGYVQHEKKYDLTPQTLGYITAQGLKTQDYTICLGTALQQQLHAEACKLFSYLAKQQKHPHIFVHDVVNFTDASVDQNKKEHISVATVLLDIAWAFAGIPIGIAESGKDAILLPYHLPQIIKGIAQAVWFVADKVAVYDPEGLGSVQAWEDADGLNEQIKKGIITAGDCFLGGIVNATWHDRIKGTTRLIADFYVPGKVYGALGHVFAEAVQQSKQLRNIENIASMLDEELGFEKYMHEIEQTAKGLNPATPEGVKAQILAEIMNAEAIAAQEAHTIVRSIEMIVTEIRALGGAIPFGRIELYNEFKTATQNFMNKINKPLSKAFSDKYSKIQIKNINVDLNLKHIAQSSIVIEKKASKGCYDILLELNHEAGTCKAFEQAGLVKIINVNKLPNGCWQYTLENLLNGTIFTKTEFPGHWNLEKIAKTAWEIYKDTSILQEAAQDGKHFKNSIIDGDVLVKIIIKNNKNSSSIKTIHPY